jgi:hypothetical protein
MEAKTRVMENAAARFVHHYVDALNAAFEALVTEEGVVVTNFVLGTAFESYRDFSGPNAHIHGHADGKGPFFLANHPSLNIVPVEHQNYDLLLRGGAFTLVLESELNVRRAEVQKDYGRLLLEEFANEDPLRLIVLRNSRKDREWRDNRFVHPLIDSWRTQQDVAIVEICWPSGPGINPKYARARMYSGGRTSHCTEIGDWGFSLSVSIEPSQINLSPGRFVTIRRKVDPEFDWKF